MPERVVVFGPPGTGKTSWAARAVEKIVERGGIPLLASYTRAAASEIARRAYRIVDDPEALPVGTIHSLAYSAIGAPPLAVTPAAIEAWNAQAPGDWALSPRTEDVDAPYTERQGAAAPGDRIYDRVSFLRNTLAPLSAYSDEERRFLMAWKAWMAQEGLVDFPGMLEAALASGKRPKRGAYTHVIVDEAQDLTPLQMTLLESWWGGARAVFMIGDDDQSLYEWAGANGALFTKGGRHVVLSRSWRLPRSVHAVALRVISAVEGRVEKEFSPRDEEGEVVRLPLSPREVARLAISHIDAGESVAIIAPTRFGPLQEVMDALLEEGAVYDNPYAPGRFEPGWGVRAVGEYAKHAWSPKRFALWAKRLSSVVIDHAGVERLLATKRDRDIIEEREVVHLIREPFIEAFLWRSPDLLLDYAPSLPRGARALLRAAKVHGLGRVLGREVVVGTIHSVKGGEADTVFLMTASSPATVRNGMTPALLRTLYVGITRARRRLYIVESGKRAIGVV